jgi:VanZ family protein
MTDTGFRLLPTRIVCALYQHSTVAALSTNVYAPATVSSLWVGFLLCTAITQLLPGDSAPRIAFSSSQVNDKIVHFSAYAAVAFVPTFGLRLGRAMPYVIATECVGTGLDLAQMFVRERSCDPCDIAANTAGILAGVVLAVVARSRLVRAERTLPDD